MDPIRRGTTPTLMFHIPYDQEMIRGGCVTFEQRGRILYEKDFQNPDVLFEGERLLVDLTQEETLCLTTVDLCRIQIRFLFEEGKTASSGIYKIPVLNTLKGGEIQ